MTTRSFELREFFHLAFLKHFSPKLSGRPYAVKGGVCLRFFHRSQRLSQDMDLDVTSETDRHRLADLVDAVLQSQAFHATLASAGIRRIAATKPKQTDTVQRWKVALHLSDANPLPTKIEFSRRATSIASSAGTPDVGLLQRYGMGPFAVRYYGAPEMAAQKIRAMASDSRFAVRDLFDLHHLFRAAGVVPSDLTGRIEPTDLTAATEKAGRFTYRDFREQVFPYLPADLSDLYANPEPFETLQHEVEEILTGML
ncbi:MAG: nucleotidyl transferase AbiEii/AbiGii toxin family protein [Pseudomonadota bacterium]